MFEIKKSGLVIVDVQGRLAHMMHNHEQLFSEICTQVKACQILGVPIFWLEQYPQGLGETVPEIKSLLSSHQPFEKVTFSSCGDHRFMTKLLESERKQLVITGIEAHVCVYQTVVELLAAGFQVAVNQDAVSSRRQSNKQLGISRMHQAGALITSTEMMLFEWMRSAEHPHFKDISKLLK